jgi:hypothetical protein
VTQHPIYFILTIKFPLIDSRFQRPKRLFVFFEELTLLCTPYSQPYLLVQVRVQFPHSIVFMRPIKSLLVLVFARASGNAVSAVRPWDRGWGLLRSTKSAQRPWGRGCFRGLQAWEVLVFKTPANTVRLDNESHNAT